MMSGRRNEIAMTSEEADQFLGTERTVICATNGVSGYPHLMPLWYTTRDREVWAWTFGKSQKIKNLERDPRATLQIETGTTYDELRGIMLECDVVLHREVDDVFALGLEILSRYEGGGKAMPEAAHAMVRKQAEKRVAMQFVERRRATWDHRKLGGAY